MTTLPIDARPLPGEPGNNTWEDPGNRAPLVLNHETFTSVTEEICRVN